jgi:localization factor PodJL
MKSGVPWSVKGVEPEAREAAKAKARRAGLTLGAWLNQVIRDTGGVELPEAELQRWMGEDDEPDPGAGADLRRVSERIEALERQQSQANREIEQALETLAIRIARTAGKPAGPDPALNERLARIESEGQKRIERLSREIGMLANRYGDIESQVGESRRELSEQLEHLAKRPAPAGDSPTLAKIQSQLAGMEGRLEVVGKEARSAATTFEQALRAVMERVVSSEKRQHEQAKSFERSLEGLAGRVSEAAEREGSNDTEAVRALERAVGEITEHFETIEKRRERASRAVEDAIKNLTERLSDSDRRHGEQLQAPFAALDRVVQRVTTQLEETDSRTEAAVSALGARIEESDARTKGALVSISKRLQESEERVKGTFAAIHKRFQESDERAQSAFASLESKIQGQDHTEQGTLAAIDTRLSDIAERIDQNDTETKASRLALMRALDETRRRVGRLEDRPYYLAEPPLEATEPEPEAEPASSFARYVAAEEQSEEAYGEEERGPEESERRAEAPLDEELGYERDPLADGEPDPPPYIGPVEEPPPFKTSEPVWALLAAARAAARSGAAPQMPGEDDETSRLNLSPKAYEDSFPAMPGPGPRAKRRRNWTRPVLISVLIIVVVGFAWQIANMAGPVVPGRPSFVRSLIESLHDAMKPKPASEAPQKSVHVAQGAPAPALPKGESVPARTVAAAPPAAPAPASRESKSPANPLTTAKLEPPAAPALTEPAPPTPGREAALKAIQAVREARSAEEREAAAKLLMKEADTGNPEAEFTLGRIYETGRGVPANLATAREWYLKAANQGHVAAAFNLGMIEAQSGTRDGYGHAARWFDQAARKGLADAQYNLGMLYAQGLGIGRDPVEAFAWFSAAAAQGDAGAAAERDRIGQALDEAARARGEALARERSSAPAATDHG